MNVTRRDLVTGVAGAALGSLVGIDPAAAQTGQQTEDQTSLRTVGQKAGIPFGLCEPSSHFPENRAYMDRLAAECSYIVPGNDFNWRNVQPARNAFQFTHLDLFARYAVEKKLGLVGHTLIWYHTVPDWLKVMEKPTDIFDAMERYINITVSRFRGKTVRWDVINEQIEPKDGLDGGLRNSFFVDRLGPDYMKFAYAKAREADPNVVLNYNEYGFEHATSDDARKRAALLSLLRKMRDDKVEVDCVGFQAHLSGDDDIDIDGLSTFTREVVSLGYKIAITELDVRDTNLPADIEVRDRMVAKKVEDFLGSVMSEAKPITITNWGFTDDKSWYQVYDWSKRRDELPLRPLAFDVNFKRKPQWEVIAAAIRKAA